MPDDRQQNPFESQQDYQGDITPFADARATPRTKIRHAITINKPPHEVFAFVADAGNLKALLEGNKGGVAVPAAWLSDVRAGTTSNMNSGLVFNSGKDADLKVDGSISVTVDEPYGTVVSIAADYSMLGSRLDEWMAFFEGQDPDHVIRVLLRRLKSFLEVGEVATTKGQPSGRSEETTKTVH